MCSGKRSNENEQFLCAPQFEGINFGVCIQCNERHGETFTRRHRTSIANSFEWMLLQTSYFLIVFEGSTVSESGEEHLHMWNANESSALRETTEGRWDFHGNGGNIFRFLALEFFYYLAVFPPKKFSRLFWRNEKFHLSREFSVSRNASRQPVEPQHHPHSVILGRFRIGHDVAQFYPAARFASTFSRGSIKSFNLSRLSPLSSSATPRFFPMSCSFVDTLEILLKAFNLRIRWNEIFHYAREATVTLDHGCEQLLREERGRKFVIKFSSWQCRSRLALWISNELISNDFL